MIELLKKIFLRESVVLSAILLNAIIIFFMAFPDMAHDPYLLSLDHIFTLFFLAEALVKIYHYGWKDYIKDGWNKFDFLIVVASLPSLLSSYIDIPASSLIQLLRLLRIVRIARFISFIPHMQQLLEGIVRAFKASFFVIIALIGLNFILSILSCHLFGDMNEERFGDPIIASYTIFQLFTVEGWNEIPTEITEGNNLANVASGLTRFYFLLIVLFGGIFGMSIANAIFVDEMTIDNNRVLEDKIDKLQEQINQLQEMLNKK